MNNNQISSITGRLGKAPVFYNRTTKKGVCPVAKFSLAVKSFSAGKHDTVWVQVSAWDKRSEICKKLQKGDAVRLDGFIGQDTFTDKKTGQQVTLPTFNAMFIELLGRPAKKDEAAQAGAQTQPTLPGIDQNNLF